MNLTKRQMKSQFRRGCLNAFISAQRDRSALTSVLDPWHSRSRIWGTSRKLLSASRHNTKTRLMMLGPFGGW
jgi:hypothetical protein